MHSRRKEYIPYTYTVYISRIIIYTDDPQVEVMKREREKTKEQGAKILEERRFRARGGSEKSSRSPFKSNMFSTSQLTFSPPAMELLEVHVDKDDKNYEVLVFL